MRFSKTNWLVNVNLKSISKISLCTGQILKADKCHKYHKNSHNNLTN